MFQKAVIRLTAWYLLIIMLLSLFFSAILYRVSVQELESFQRRQETVLRRGVLPPGSSIEQWSEDRLVEARQSERRIALNLVYFNILIFILGGGLSYLLAAYTLHPIAEALEKQKRFASDASHELRTPLTAMKTEIEVALRDKKMTIKELRELQESLLEELEKLEQLTSDLLHLTKSQIDSQLLDMPEVVEGAIRKVKGMAKVADISIVQTVEAARVKGDKQRLIELLTILLDNALKYSPSGSEINVTSKLRKNDLVLIVSDSGMGIEAKDLPHIFERFYRADRSRTKNAVKGFGLGLSIAKQIVEMHNGHIEVESRPGVGTTFSVTLPRSLERFG